MQINVLDDIGLHPHTLISIRTVAENVGMSKSTVQRINTKVPQSLSV